jgi:hypothetical protein
LVRQTFADKKDAATIASFRVFQDFYFASDGVDFASYGVDLGMSEPSAQRPALISVQSEPSAQRPVVVSVQSEPFTQRPVVVSVQSAAFAAAAGFVRGAVSHL